MRYRRVLFNGRYLGRRSSGVERFAHQTVLALDGLIAQGSKGTQGIDWQIAVPAADASALGVPYRQIAVAPSGRLKGHLWEQLELRGQARPDTLLVNLCNTGPVRHRAQLSVIHDVASVRVPQSYSRAFRWWYAAMTPQLYRHSAAVGTVSRFSLQELRALYGPRDGVHVLPEGADHMSALQVDADALGKFGLRGVRYVLAVSSLSPHKNFKRVIEAAPALAALGLQVMVAGATNPAVFGDALQSGQGVRFLGFVSDSELKALFENAQCFVFPSIYEGYGLPPTEAMACGCPVVASQAAAIPETCADAALYFDPENVTSLIDAIRQVTGQPEVRSRLQEAGKVRAATLTWDKSARSLLQIIEHLQQ